MIFTQLIEAGLSCIPIRLDGSKAPAIAAWKQFQGRRPAAEEAAEWDRKYRAVALICGPISGNLEVIDLDSPAMVRPYLEAVAQEAPQLYENLTLVATPRRNESGQRGCHVLYRVDQSFEVPGNQKLAMSEPLPEISEDGNPVLGLDGKPMLKPQALIESRGRGGYVLTVGSAPEAHPSNRKYEHRRGPQLTELSTITADQRQLLIDLAKTFDRSVVETHSDPKPEGYRGSDRRPGDQYADQTSWADILVPAGWTKVGESAGIVRWRRPGKTKGWSATTGLLSKAGHELLCVFSSNAHPFPGPSAGRSCSTHGKFDAHALLSHNGDHKAAAAHLASLGYGDPPRKAQREQRVLVKTLEQYERDYVGSLSRGWAAARSTGIRELDEALVGGIEPGEIVLIGAPTSHGKTLMGLQLARQEIAQRRNAVILSEEMTGMQLAKRSLQTRVDLPADQWAAVTPKIEAGIGGYWRQRGTAFVLESLRTMPKIEAAVNQIAAEYDIGIIVLDYAGLVRGRDKASRYETVSDTSSRFAALTRKHGAIGVLIAQLNRAGTDNAHLGSFKDTSQLEQDADVCLLLEWLIKSNPDHPNPRDLRVRIGKNRNRGIAHNEVMLQLYPERQEIRGYADQPESHCKGQHEWIEQETPDGTRQVCGRCGKFRGYLRGAVE